MSDFTSNFQQVSIANALQVHRPEVGNMAPVALFRLVRLVVMEDLFGRAAGAPAYLAGKQLGRNLGLTHIDQFLKLCDDLKIGRVQITEHDPHHLHIDVHECVTCAGLTPVGRTLCAFEGGLMAGVIEGIHGKPTQAKEITCIGGLGDETCGFDLVLRT